ncbi:hypothetical protein Plut_1804 [Pelodictyon luteolum DSM 273]|uniref:O-antigen ligase-related domain-containing protein n=1 Tax=Chlorobium luteolum (strain DSM 273 / BCRC 81028 / 2530) TaxID=319225 RepID=Q3B1X3_CHLL3|nr:hypothetical protein Plut_1804 [Pelodictyon luteolum DSM 273]
MTSPHWVSTFRLQVRNVRSYLFILLGFALPFSVAAGNILVALFLVLLLIGGVRREDWTRVRHSPVVLAVSGFFVLHLIGLLWTEDMPVGLHVVAKAAYLLLIPIFMLGVKPEHMRRYLWAFLAAMVVQAIWSYGIWLQLLPTGTFGGPEDPVMFMGRITYSPFLAIAVYLSLALGVLERGAGWGKKLFTLSLGVFLAVDLFLTQGRAGHVAFFVVAVIAVFQYFSGRRWVAGLVSLVMVAGLFTAAYTFSDAFKGRLGQAVSDSNGYEMTNSTSVGTRITFVLNSMEIFKEHPLIGVGTGDFRVEYARMNERMSPAMPATHNPHDMYALEMVQFGVLGLAALLWILYLQVSFARKSNNPLQRNVGVALPLIYGVIMFSDSYLFGHFSTLLFVYLSAFLYRDLSGSEGIEN